MATKFLFNNKTASKPDIYAQTKSGITNAAQALPYGNILIIDTGSGAEFGVGSGITGTLKQNQDSVYEFTTIDQMRNEIGGGLWWLLAKPLFKPYKTLADGVAKIYYVRAAETTPAEITYSFVGGCANGGNFVLQCAYEGKVGNGYLDETLATAQVRITAAGTGGDTVEITVDGDVVATYDVESGDSILDIVAGLVTDGNSSIYSFANDGGGYFTIKAPRKSGVDGNSLVPAVVVTGTNGAAGTTPATFTGGVDGTDLVQGFAAKMVAGTVDNSKFKILFYRGSFKGIDSDGDSYDGVSINDTDPILIASSIEFSNIQSLIDWMGANSNFAKYFTLKSSTVIGTGTVDSTDLTNNAGYNLASGGKETFNTTHLDTVLDNISNYQFTHILSDQWGDRAKSSDNGKILTHIVDEARYRKYLVVGGGKDSDKWTGIDSSLDIASFYNTNRVITIHGGVKKNVNWVAKGYKEYDSIYHAALALGRVAGLPPQVPCTLKALEVDGVSHPLNETEITQGLDGGVWMLQYDTELEAFVVVQSINTLQNNDYLILEDGTSHDHTIERIAAQLELEIIVNAKRQLLGQQQGPNRNTLSPAIVQSWTEAFLGRKLATTTQDNLIVGYQDVTVTVDQDAYFINFGYIPNGPVNKLFFTGFMLDFTA